MPKTFKYKIEALFVGLSLLFAVLTLPSSLYAWHHLPRWVPKIFTDAIERMARNQRPIVHASNTPPSSFQKTISKIFKGFHLKKQSEGEVSASKPLTQAASLLASLKLSGIIAGAGGGSQAIINDDIFGVGQTVAGYTVIQIDSNRVILSKENEKYSLTIEGLKKLSQSPASSTKRPGAPI